MIATKQIYIKPSNLKKIQDGTIEGSKFFAYIKLLENKGSEVLMPAETLHQARWFPQAQLNFAANLLRYRDDKIALIEHSESGQRRAISYNVLYTQVARLAAAYQRRSGH